MYAIDFVYLAENSPACFCLDRHSSWLFGTRYPAPCMRTYEKSTHTTALTSDDEASAISASVSNGHSSLVWVTKVRQYALGEDRTRRGASHAACHCHSDAPSAAARAVMSI